MPITMGPITTEERVRTDPDTGEQTKYTRICVTLYNSGDQAERRKVTFYKELIPQGGATPSNPARHTELCTTPAKDVPAKKVLAHGEGPGSETFCCDLTYVLALGSGFGREH